MPSSMSMSKRTLIISLFVLLLGLVAVPQQVVAQQDNDDDDNDCGGGIHQSIVEQGTNKEDCVPSFLVRPVPRVGNITIDEFRNYHARADMATPLIFENDISDDDDLFVFDPSDWTRDKITKLCGHVPLLLSPSIRNEDEDTCASPRGNHTWGCHKVHFVNDAFVGREWAGMDVANLVEWNITTLGDLIRLQDTPEGEHLVLLDAPLSHYCPPARERLRLPKYFARNYNSITYDPWDEPDMESAGQDNFHPAIFMAKKGTGTPLHGDSRMERFYFQQLAGRKLWRLFGPSEYKKLYPAVGKTPNGEFAFSGEGYYPVHFHVDAMNPDFGRYPEMDGALMYEAILEAGDVMFVPGGWAHQVINLEDTIATGLNFIDEYGLQPAIAYTRQRKGEREYEASERKIFYEAYFFPLDPLWPKESPDESSISFEDYFYHLHLPNEEVVPSTVVEFVDSQTTKELNEWRSPEGFSALTLAVFFNFRVVVEYLIEVGHAEVKEKDSSGSTALEYAESREYDDLAEYLESKEEEQATSGEDDFSSEPKLYRM